MTLEVFLELDAPLSQVCGVLTKGTFGQRGDVPYSLTVTQDGKLTVAYQDDGGGQYAFTTDAGPVSAGKPCKVAVTRHYQMLTSVTKEPSSEVYQRDTFGFVEITFYVNGQPVPCSQMKQQVVNDESAGTTATYTGARQAKEVGSNQQPLVLGRDANGFTFKGSIAEVRLWGKALAAADVGQPLSGSSRDLVARWTFDEGQGDRTRDVVGDVEAAIHEAEWTIDPFPENSRLTLYLDGKPQPTASIPAFAATADGLTLDGSTVNLDELRIWDTVRTQEQIEDNMFTRLKGEKDLLIAYYPFDDATGAVIPDHSLRGNHLPVSAQPSGPAGPAGREMPQVAHGFSADSTGYDQIPLDARPAAAEYGDLQLDSEKRMTGVLKRCYSYLTGNAWNLLTGFKVGNLVTEWVAQIQGDPQLVGYVEGAPPVPSENLTSTSIKLGELADYSDAASVALDEAENVSYAYASSQESGRDFSLALGLAFGFEEKADVGLVLSEQVADVQSKLGLRAHLNTSFSNLEEGGASVGTNTSQRLSLDLRGAWQDDVPSGYINPAVGRRFLPENKGLALVKSATLDVFALRLEHNHALVAYRVLPNPDIPVDVNLIPFPINPLYTKQGTLDGRVGVTEVGGVQCDPDYPMAASYGEYSYFKPREAYRLKRQIDGSYQELKATYDRYSTSLTSQSGALGVLDEILGGMISALNATGESLTYPKDLARRSIANTYVWTAEGGFFAEATQAMDAVEESYTGSISLDAGVGLFADIGTVIFGPAMFLEFSADFGFQFHATKQKRRQTERSFSLDVSAAGDCDLQLYVNTDQEKALYAGRVNEGGGAYDAKGQPVLRPGKVDAYRFMTFYLEPSSDNFDDFFHKVVDPLWLAQGTGKNAAALRQAKQASGGSWRILHRVTFVSRVLSSFGENASDLDKAAADLDIASNYELIQRLAPYVRDKTDDFVAFVDAVRRSVQQYLPELVPHTSEIMAFLCDYYGVYE